MNKTIFNFIKKQNVSSLFLANLLMLSVGILLLFCLPIGLFDAQLFALNPPSIIFSFFLMSFIIILGSFDTALKQRIRISHLTKGISACILLALIPFFYVTSKSASAWQYSINLILIFLIFISFQQFNFNLKQQKLILFLPVLVSWVFFAFLTDFIGFFSISLSDGELLQSIEPSLALFLLTAIALSPYLLVREQKQKALSLSTVMLLLTPMLAMGSLTLLANGSFFALGFALALFAQPYLFRQSIKLQHALWLLFFAIGSLFASRVNPLNVELFSPSAWLEIKQAAKLLLQNPIYGVGFGQLENQILLAKIAQGIEPNSYQPFPSWLLKIITEGGVAMLLAVISAFFLIVNRIYQTKAGTRLVLFSMLLPSFYCMLFTGYASLSAISPLLFVLLLYWIDNLGMPYQRIKLAKSKAQAIVNRMLLALSVLLTCSSIFLNFEANRVNQLSIKRLEQYQKHPLWHDFFSAKLAQRQFIKSVEQGDIKAMNKFIIAQRDTLAARPTPDGYQRLINMAKMARNKELKEQSLREAKRLFPSHQYFAK